MTAVHHLGDEMSDMDFFQPLRNHLKLSKKDNQKIVNKGNDESQKR